MRPGSRTASLSLDVVSIATFAVAALALTLISMSNRKAKRRSIQQLVRNNVLTLSPYRCARDDYDVGVLLDANENSYGPCVEMSGVHSKFEKIQLNRYPDPRQNELKSYLSKIRRVDPKKIFVGVGSDEAIDLLMRIFCEPGEDEILITPPTYGMYKVCAKINDVKVRTSFLTKDFEVDVDDLLSTITNRTKMIFFCSPGNPTAVSIPADVVRKVHQSFDGIIVVDEAYVDFSRNPSATELLYELDRIVVLQTLSKAYGLAGIRIGMAYGSEFVIDLMNRVKAPYNVNALSQTLACEALKDLSLYRQNVSSIIDQREKLMETLRKEPYVKRVLRSEANFFLIEIKHAHTIYLHMAENGVVVRYRGTELHCNDCLRVTVGTSEQNEKLLKLLRETVKGIEGGKIPLRE